jgi:hypothetical protein
LKSSMQVHIPRRFAASAKPTTRPTSLFEKMPARLHRDLNRQIT